MDKTMKLWSLSSRNPTIQNRIKARKKPMMTLKHLLTQNQMQARKHKLPLCTDIFLEDLFIQN
jgi:predicted XRE-type DNA-binding protein